jgi:glyoxylase-like metal-dependent hydrolase (beta-lactamase superfamily II)
MPASPSIHALRIPFRLTIGPGRTLERFVYAYLILGERISLIDCGVAGSDTLIVDYIRQAGRDPKDLALAILTHAHPDHIGGLAGLRRRLDFRVAAHADAVDWIEDVELQFRQRPVPGFHELVGGSVRVDMRLADGERLDLGPGCTLEVLHTPGHAAGHVALFDAEQGALFSGDAIPTPGALPIYDDPLALIRSLRRLRSIRHVRRLYSSWDEPREGDAYARIDAGVEYLCQVHQWVVAEQTRSPGSTAHDLTEHVLNRLGLAVPVNPLLIRSIEAHRPLTACEELRCPCI